MNEEIPKEYSRIMDQLSAQRNQALDQLAAAVAMVQAMKDDIASLQARIDELVDATADNQKSPGNMK